jgi:hypothetical protein
MLRYLVATIILLVGTTSPAVAQDEAELRAGVVKIVSILDGKRRTGTGVAVKVDGTSVYIVTAAHVIEGDPKPKVEFFSRQNTLVSATVIKQDLRYDLALLKVESPQPPLVLKLETTAAPKTGDEVTTIGFPQTGGAWLISRADLAGRDGADFILSGGAIDEGNSGGPIIKGGKVIGVVQGLQGKFARAMPASMVVDMLDGWGIALAPEIGNSTSQDDKRSTDAERGSIDYSNFEQVKKAADRGDAKAMDVLGDMYSEGKVTRENFAEAAKWYRRSADAGYVEAYAGMGLFSLLKAVGLADGDDSAVRFVRDDSKRGELQRLLMNPQTFRIQNQAEMKEAVRWLRKGAEEGHDANAQFMLGLLAASGVGVEKNPVQAAKWMRLAATKEPIAQALMGLYYFSGFGVEQDFTEASRYLRQAAEKDVPLAYGPLGGMYAGGFGVVQDYTEAAKWLRKGADHGFSDAKAGLSLLHFLGQGVPQDFNIAYRLAKESAEQGEPMGQYVLGLMFFSGKGVPQNAGESLKWMQAAARHGEGHAQQFLQERGQSW